MDAVTADLPVISEHETWLQRERASGRFYDRLAWIIAIFLAGMIALSVWLLRGSAEPGNLLSPSWSRCCSLPTCCQRSR